MRFKQFLYESTENKVEIIKKDCKQFLSQTDVNHPLYRGIWPGDVPKNKMQPIKVLKNRLPRNTPKELHNLFNLGFSHSKFRIPARSTTLFCSGNMGQAHQYGDCYYIFPIGKFKIIWSEHITDLFTYPDDIDVGVAKTLNVNNKKDANIFLFMLYVALLQLKQNPRCQRLIEFTKNITTVKKALSFYDITYDPTNIDKLESELRFYSDEFAESFVDRFYNEGNLKAAIESKNEIMISCDTYYALSVDENKSIWKALF